MDIKCRVKSTQVLLQINMLFISSSVITTTGPTSPNHKHYMYMTTISDRGWFLAWSRLIHRHKSSRHITHTWTAAATLTSAWCRLNCKIRFIYIIFRHLITYVGATGLLWKVNILTLKRQLCWQLQHPLTSRCVLNSQKLIHLEKMEIST